MAVQTIEAAIVQKLRATAAITALVASGEISANVADQDSEQSSAPYIVVITDDREDEQSQDGTGISSQSIFTDIYHEGVQDAGDIAVEIRTALQDYSGTHDSIIIQEMWLVNSTMARDNEVDKHVYRLAWQTRIVLS